MGIVFISPLVLGRFKSGLLPFHTVTALNDPFLLNRDIHQPAVDSAELSANEFEQAVHAQYALMSEHMRGMVSWEYYWQQAQKNAVQIREQLSKRSAAAPLPLPDIKYYARVCCLRVFTEPHSPLLWDLHGGAGSNIAVELDIQQDFFVGKQAAGQPQLWAALEYAAGRPQAPNKNQPFPALLRRPQTYAFEKEWRLIRPLSAQVEGGMAYYPYPYALVKAVYFQPRANPAEETQLLTWLSQDLHFRRVPVWRLDLHAHDLQFNPRRLR